MPIKGSVKCWPTLLHNFHFIDKNENKSTKYQVANISIRKWRNDNSQHDFRNVAIVLHVTGNMEIWQLTKVIKDFCQVDGGQSRTPGHFTWVNVETKEGWWWHKCLRWGVWWQSSDGFLWPINHHFGCAADNYISQRISRWKIKNKSWDEFGMCRAVENGLEIARKTFQHA